MEVHVGVINGSKVARGMGRVDSGNIRERKDK